MGIRRQKSSGEPTGDVRWVGVQASSARRLTEDGGRERRGRDEHSPHALASVLLRAARHHPPPAPVCKVVCHPIVQLSQKVRAVIQDEEISRQKSGRTGRTAGGHLAVQRQFALYRAVPLPWDRLAIEGRFLDRLPAERAEPAPPVGVV
jgi:hypothetical protein